MYFWRFPGITWTDAEFISPQRALQKINNLNPEEQKQLRRIVGQLNLAVQGSRPDTAFEMVYLSTKLRNGTVSDLL